MKRKLIQLHLYPARNVLKPRGSMAKESIGIAIYERLQGAYESWTKPGYGDNPDKATLLRLLEKNLWSETEVAWKRFLADIEKQNNGDMED